MTVTELYEAIGGNYTAVLDRLMSEKFISKYIIKFVNDKSYTELMEEWNGEKREEELFKKAHTLKGVCANLALDKLFETISKITDHFRPGEEYKVDNIEQYFTRLQNDYDDTVKLINQFSEEHPA